MGSLRFSEFADSPAMILSPHQHSFGSVSSYHSSLQQYHSFKPFRPADPSQKPYFRPLLMAQSPPRSSPASGIKRKRDSFDGEPNTPSAREKLPTDASQSINSPMDIASGQISLATPNNDATNESSIETTPTPTDRQKFRRRETLDTLNLTTTGPNNTIIPGTPNPATQSPHIDELTHLLGIGWTHIASNSDPDLQKATRGWEKYIENSYPLSSVAILATSKAMDGAFLVIARDYENFALKRFWLFKEDLSEGRLVASDWEKCLARLIDGARGGEGMAFEGAEALRAQRATGLMPASESGMKDLEGLPPVPGNDDDGIGDVMQCD